MLQFLGNMVVQHKDNQATAWSRFFPRVIETLLVEYSRHRKVIAYTTAMVLNCLHGPASSSSSFPSRSPHDNTQDNGNDNEYFERSKHIVFQSRSLVLLWLQLCCRSGTRENRACLHPDGSDIHHEANAFQRDNGNGLHDESDVALEWTGFLFHVLAERHGIAAIYEPLSLPDRLLWLRLLEHMYNVQGSTNIYIYNVIYVYISTMEGCTLLSWLRQGKNSITSSGVVMRCRGKQKIRLKKPRIVKAL